MTDKLLPSPEMLRKLLRYEPETGFLFWLPREHEFFKSDRDCMAWNTRFCEKQAFCHTKALGYQEGVVMWNRLYAHRVIWAMQTGTWPENQIDHIDNDPSNNKWVNLRAATRAENSCNKTKKKNSTSKYLGVYLYRDKKTWIAKASKNNKNIHIGYFKSEEDAARAYDLRAKQVHGEFANLNFGEL
jgi:hypothetical protein